MGNDDKEKIKLEIRRILQAYARALQALPGGGSVVALSDALKELRGSEASLDMKIREAFGSLNKTNHLIEQLQIDLAERNQKLNAVREDYEKYSKLASVEKDKAMEFVNEMERQLHHERYVNLSISVLTGVVIFFLGIVVGHYLNL